MLTVLELRDSNLPKAFTDLLPTHCPTCNWETKITPSLTELCCTNPSCGGKTVRRMVSMLKDMKVKGMGESKCKAFLEHFDTSNPYLIFLYDPREDGVLYSGCSEDFSFQIYEQVQEKREMQLWEYIKYGNLEGIQDSARAIFARYDDLREFYDDLETGGISFIQDLLSISGGVTGVSVTAISTYETLMKAKEDLLLAVDYVDIVPIGENALTICISKSVGGNYGSKDEYATLMKNRYGHKVTLNFVKSFSKDCDALLWAGGEPTEKVKTLLKRNAKIRQDNLDNGLPEDEGTFMCMNGEEFEEFLKSL